MCVDPSCNRAKLMILGIKQHWIRTALCVLIASVTHILHAQSLSKTDFANLFSIKEYPRLDSSINVSALSREECNQLIERMFEVDQQYRDSLNRNMQDEVQFKRFGRLITVNDVANRAVLLKILKRYGWPCDTDKRKLSYKAWFIPWHIRSNHEMLSEFYSYMKKADTTNCINANQLKTVRDQIELVKKLRGRSD